MKNHLRTMKQHTHTLTHTHTHTHTHAHTRHTHIFSLYITLDSHTLSTPGHQYNFDAVPQH